MSPVLLKIKGGGVTGRRGITEAESITGTGGGGGGGCAGDTDPWGNTIDQNEVVVHGESNWCIVCDTAIDYPDEGSWASFGRSVAHLLGYHDRPRYESPCQ